MSSTTCRPPVGKTYLAIGQDFQSIQEYVMSQYNASQHRHLPEHTSRTSETQSLEYFVPSTTMVYTDIQTLRGLTHPADYGSGIEYAWGLAEAFPDSGIQIGLWLNGTKGCLDIVSGRLDHHIGKLFDFIKDLPSSVPQVFLRVGYEFDNPWLGYSDSPSTYRQAFRKLVYSCRHQLGHQYCQDNVAFVWHSWAAPRVVTDLDEFYPGDDIVDWVGISIFQQVYPWANGVDADDFAGGNMQQVLEVLDFARHHQKPIMIAESTPFGGMNIAATKYKNITDHDIIWDLWFQKTLDLIDAYDISMWSYINCDWDSLPMWHGIGFGDTRLVSSNVVMNRWWDNVLKNTSRFVHRIQNCNGEARAGGTTTAVLPRMALNGIFPMKRIDQGLTLLPWPCVILLGAFLILSSLGRKLVFGRQQTPKNESFMTPIVRVRRQTYGSIP